MARISSNAWANGSDQNCGNFITDTPTTRVNAPPGGASSFSLAWGGGGGGGNEGGARGGAPQGNRQPGGFGNDDRGGRMQYNERDRYGPSDAGFSDARGGFNGRGGPPNGSEAPDRYDMDGGRGAVLGGYGGPPPQQQRPYEGREYDRPPPDQGRSEADYRLGDYRGGGGGGPNQGPPSQAGGRGPPPENETFGGRAYRPSSNAFAMGSNQNCGNVLTDTPTTRVNAPPGGQTSVCLNWDTSGAPQGPPQRQGQNYQNERSAPPAPWEADSHYQQRQPDHYQNGGAGRDPGGMYEGDRGRGGDYRDDYRRQDQYGRQPGPDMAGPGPNGHGSRPRVSGNTFANGSNQNCGNVLTDTPSTRVVAPPGGASSFNLGWQTDNGAGGPGSNSPQRRGGGGGFGPGEGPRGEGAYQQGPPPPRGQYEERGYDDRQQRYPEAQGSPHCRPDNGYDPYDAGQDIEGSRPRSYKPGIRLNAPPGGGSTFSPDWDPEVESRNGGKKLFPGSNGAGNNRDMAAIESMRYYQTEERPGKSRPDMGRPIEDPNARDSHRYYLAGDDRADRVPGKAQCSPHGREGAGDHMSWPEQDSVYNRRNQQLHAQRPF